MFRSAQNPTRLRAVRDQLKFFAPYAAQFEAFVDSSLREIPVPEGDRASFVGLEPYEALRSMVPLSELRALGVFFTGVEIADQVWDPVLSTLSVESVVVDPACGAGDLLLKPAAHLAGRYEKTSELSFQIRGADLEDSFLRTARARLRFRHAQDGRTEAFHRFEQRNFLSDPSSVRDATHVVMNPPFFAMQAPAGCSWGAGSVNSAAVFVMKALESMKEGARLLAVLPDVLRSGARYQKWRSQVANLSGVSRVQTLGQFDQATDVHVFILDVVIKPADRRNGGPGESKWPEASEATAATGTVADFFEVRVGPVVPHRDPQTGPEVPFLTTKTIAASTFPTETRKFSGRLYSGPMVLISRTSRPGQSPRARATIWMDDTFAAVENHLLVLKPLDGKIESCKRLVALLHDSKTTDFLDARIRCRHLTVGAVREIPWLEMETP